MNIRSHSVSFSKVDLTLGSGGGLVCWGGGAPPDTCPGGGCLSGRCLGGVRGRTSGKQPRTTPRTGVREGGPDTLRTSVTPPGQGIPASRLPKHPSIFSSTVSLFEAFCVRSRTDFYTSRETIFSFLSLRVLP